MGCEGVFGVPVSGSAPVADAGIGAPEADAGADSGIATEVPDAGVPFDAGRADAGPGDAGAAAVDAGGAAFDGGAFPIVDGPRHGAVPVVTEGPTFLAPTQGVFDDTCSVVWNPLAHELLVTVCQENAIWRYRSAVTANQGFDVVRPGGQNVFGMQGMAVLPDGALVVAETVSHQLTVSRGGYAAPQPFVTDPRTESGGGSAPFTAVYRVSPSGQVSAHLKDLGARGLALSYDQRTLYLSAENHYGEAQLYKVALDEAGAVGASTLFAGTAGSGIGAYGLCVDQADNVYHAARSGLRIYGPSGAILGTIDVPGADDCAFGDDDARTLYVTTSSSLAVHNLYRVRVDVPGLY
jgi:hypothetical protein